MKIEQPCEGPKFVISVRRRTHGNFEIIQYYSLLWHHFIHSFALLEHSVYPGQAIIHSPFSFIKSFINNRLKYYNILYQPWNRCLLTSLGRSSFPSRQL